MTKHISLSDRALIEKFIAEDFTFSSHCNISTPISVFKVSDEITGDLNHA